jgi:non-specific serine/threonine protein kinase
MSNNNSFFTLKNNTIYRKSKINKKYYEKGDDNINKNIGPYIITNKIKEGNNSKIYLGKSKYTNDEVAIKAISKEILLDNIEDLSLILNHIESLKILKHKNIISLYEIYESPQYFYLIMEYFPKKNLIEKIIQKKRLNENESLIIFVQLLDALVYMHKMNITHRNIRTEHILFDKNNRPIIIGFNYSTFYEKNKKINGMFGSLCYTCPEILNDEDYNPELADVWSLGVVLYVMICGYLPFSEENDEKNKDLIVSGKIEYPKEMSNKLKDLLKHILDPNPKKRYDINKIMKHPWFKPYNDKLIGGCNPLKMYFPIDDKILNIIEKFGFDKNKVKLDLKNNMQSC